jgi:hypothetical protein
MTSRLPSALLTIALLILAHPALPAAETPPTPAAESPSPPAADAPSESAHRMPLILVVDLSGLDPAQRILAVSIQGIANRHPDGPRVFLLTNPRDEEWLDYCLRLSPRTTQLVTVEQLLETLRPDLQGQILYDPNQPYTLDIATTAAGIHQSAISPTDLGLPTILDLRGRWQSSAEAYRWAADSLLPQCTRTRAALLPSDAIAMRDFAIQNRLFTLSPPSFPDDPTFEDILLRLSPGAAIYGAADPALITSLSAASHYLVSAANAANLSFFSRLDTGRRFHQYIGYLEPVAPRYLTFILDCSDLDVAINGMPVLWDDPARGSLPLGWAIPAALADAAPPVLHRYYADAYRSGSDQFLLGPSGAGDIDRPAGNAPYSFFTATARARARLDIDTSCYRASASTPASDVTHFARETRTRGIFLLDAPDTAPILLDGVPTLSAHRVDTVAAAIDYLNNIPLERRAAALFLNPHTLGPAEAAHIAAHVSDRYVVVPPEEMIAVLDLLTQPPQPGTSTARFASVTYPESAHPDLPLPVTAVADPPEQILSASLVYRPAEHALLFSEPMSPTPDGYAAEIPPLFCGGPVQARIRARDRAGRVAWLSEWTFDIPRSDADSDGLTDAEERFLLTDPADPDTDADGLRDLADRSPLRLDRRPVTYLGPIYPPSDLPYLPDPGASLADSQGRHLQPGQSCLYWLPLATLPPGAPAVIALDALGPAVLDVGAEPDRILTQFAGRLDQTWYSAPLPPEARQAGAFLRVTCPADAQEPLLLEALAVLSPPAAPSIGRILHVPAYPGPGQPITISALIFSPDAVAGATLTYRINAGGTIGLPMQQLDGSQYYRIALPALDNRDDLEWWITARDSQGNVAVSSPSFLPIGGRARHVVPALARREFSGDWVSAHDWNGAARLAPSPGARDSAAVNLPEATYTVWILGGGRGHTITCYVGDKRIGSLDPRAPDGWHQLGRIRLEASRHHVTLVSELGPDAPPDAAPRYASLIFSSDTTFVPPPGQVLDLHNHLVLLAPRAGDVLRGRVDLKATGAGNMATADFTLDGELVRHASGPPFDASLNTRRFTNGPHTLRVEIVERTQPTGLAVEIPIVIAN